MTDIAEKYNVDGYPTVKLIYKGTVYDYEAKPDRDNLIKFLEYFLTKFDGKGHSSFKRVSNLIFFLKR